MGDQLMLNEARRTPPAKMIPQCRKLLRYLRERGSITPLEAQEHLGIGRLGARVWDLIHKHGYRIESGRVTVKTREGKARVAKYSLEEEGEA